MTKVQAPGELSHSTFLLTHCFWTDPGSKLDLRSLLGLGVGERRGEGGPGLNGMFDIEHLTYRHIMTSAFDELDSATAFFSKHLQVKD